MFEELYLEGGKKLGLDLEGKIEDFETYKVMIQETNKSMNLTAITDDKEMISKHFLDSLTCFNTNLIQDNMKVIDVGTGAGFPGVPMKIYNRTLKLTLLDSLAKRINFLEEVGEQLGFEDVEYIHGRAEDFGVDEAYREQYDIVVSRAVANLAVLSEYCLPFVKVGGYFISQKGKKSEMEIEAARNALEILGGEVVDVLDIELPHEEITHALVIIKKIRQTPAKYPRKAGKPNKKPL